MIHRPGQRRVLLDEEGPPARGRDCPPSPDEEALLAARDAATPQAAEYLPLVIYLRRRRGRLPDGLDVQGCERALSRLSRKRGLPVKRAPDGRGGLAPCFALPLLLSFCPPEESAAPEKSG